MTTDVTEQAIMSPFKLKAEYDALEDDIRKRQAQLAKLRTDMEAVVESSFRTELAALCDKYRIALMAGHGVYIEHVRKDVVFTPGNVLEQM